MATGKKSAHDASELLKNRKTPSKTKEVAGSDLAQTPKHPKKKGRS